MSEAAGLSLAYAPPPPGGYGQEAAPAGTGAFSLSAAPRRQLAGIEALRGLAAVAVVAYHASRHVDKALGAPGLAALFQPGQAGVDMFFVLSGFIILHVHRRDIGRPGRLRHYLGRRFTRVLPLYWVALLATIIMGLAASPVLPGGGRLLLSVLLLPSYPAPLLGVAWTLQFEMLFYASFALLILSSRLGVLVLGCWLLCIGGTLCGADLSVLPPQFTGIYGIEFFLGMGTAQLLHTGMVARPAVIAGAGAALFALAMVFGVRGAGEFGVAARFLFGLPAAMIVLGTAALDQAGAVVVPRWARVPGSASYSIYLFQFIFIGAVWQVARHAGLGHWTLFLLLGLAAVAGGVGASRLVERPLMGWLRK